MKYTGNYNLKKPDGTDVVNIEDLNENADIIDAELKKLNDAIKDLDADGITLPDGKTISEKFEEITEEVGNIQELNTDEKANIVAAINEINQALVAHKAESAIQAHKAKNIAIDDTGNHFNATNVEGALEELFTSVSNGKTLIAGAITDKGVVASPSDTWSTLANAIASIQTGVNIAKISYNETVNAGDVFTVSGISFKPTQFIVFFRTNRIKIDHTSLGKVETIYQWGVLGYGDIIDLRHFSLSIYDANNVGSILTVFDGVKNISFNNDGVTFTLGSIPRITIKEVILIG